MKREKLLLLLSFPGFFVVATKNINNAIAVTSCVFCIFEMKIRRLKWKVVHLKYHSLNDMVHNATFIVVS